MIKAPLLSDLDGAINSLYLFAEAFRDVEDVKDNFDGKNLKRVTFNEYEFISADEIMVIIDFLKSYKIMRNHIKGFNNI